MSDDEKRLMVIDDDTVILESIRRQLRDEFLRIDFEANPEAALTRLKHDTYDLVLCDIKMKPINGIEVLRRIKSDYAELPVIIVSAFVDDQLFDQARELGCEDFLIKPVPRITLRSAVARALGRSAD